MLGGHWKSGVSSDRPLQTQLGYAIDIDSENAVWFSVQEYPDKWTRNYIMEWKPFKTLYENTSRKVWQGKAQNLSHAKSNDYKRD